MPSISTSAVPYAGDEFVLNQRRELSARRASYREQAARIGAALDEFAAAGEEPDLGDDEGFAEADQISVERDRILSLTATTRRRIEDVDAALHRLDAGTYGACRTCRRPIAMARLEAVPEATQCVACASGSVLRRR